MSGSDTETPTITSSPSAPVSGAPADASATPPVRWYQLDITETESQLGTSASKGLNAEEAAARLSQYGPN